MCVVPYSNYLPSDTRVQEAVEIQQDVARWVEEARRPAWSPIWTPAWLANPTVVTGLMALSSALPSSDRLTVRCIRAAGTFILCASLTK